jgi:cob(I)alamin adenosyltransferase
MSTEWTQLFTDFEQTLNQWLARTTEPPPLPDSPPAEPAILRLFEERLMRLQTYLDKTEHDAEQALAPLTIEIQALQQWLDALHTARNKRRESTAPCASEKGARRA